MTHPFQFHETLLITRPEALKSVIGRETLLVCGAARGMTSVVSYTLYELGYFIGSELLRHNFEDRDFMQAVLSFDLVNKPLKRRKPLLELIERRNAAHARWGFKLPDAVNHVRDLPPLLRNPVVVLCIRNPVAVGRSIMTRNPAVKGGITTAMDKGLKAMAAIPYLLDGAPYPSLILDMDAVQRQPEMFLREFMAALDLTGDAGAIAERISSKGYKQSDPREGITFHAEPIHKSRSRKT